MKVLILAAALSLAAVSSAHSQGVRVRATVEQVDGNTLTVKSREGETLKVKLAGDANVMAVVPAKLDDIKPGSFVGAAALPEQNGRWKAVEVHIFPEAARGTGEGDRPFDYRPRSTMTNGTVSNMASGGQVEKAQGSALTLKFREGEKQVEVTPETVIVALTPGNRDEIKPGAKIFIASATKQSDGSLAAARINVGRGVAPPM